ncbi:12921_t:CDS:2 [Entrophospora sp. SA101]|nr:12921_t:CDS:2 [Entrophospora sp. SA101]
MLEVSGVGAICKSEGVSAELSSPSSIIIINTIAFNANGIFNL